MSDGVRSGAHPLAAAACRSARIPNAALGFLGADDADELTRLSAGLAEGGTVRAALGPAGCSPLFGMVTDRFGGTWVLDLAVAYAG
ncbi:hypothetical protein CLV35_3035 [Motilibacter peucedani]|uniref:PhnB protein n=1 Tax=Motilibacter peucedani TaxID=598650 RepID=A0A420XNC5_9ACTN|nr:hypothetical protein [Motilibacter peucedani]RKS72784.1 hypothetical protein CLV35_3035 [Motilibacter peucedani]